MSGALLVLWQDYDIRASILSRTLRDEARSWAHGYAQMHKMNFEDAWRVSQGWRASARRPGRLWPYERVLRFYLPLKRLRRFLFALRELAEETVMKAPPPLLSLFGIREQ